MKFSVKLVLYMTAMIAIIFSGAGIFIINQNFNYSLENVTNQSVNQHMLERYAIESNMVNSITKGEEITNKKLEEYATALSKYMGNTPKLISLYSKEREQIYSNLPSTIGLKEIAGVLNEQGDTYIIRNIAGKRYIMISSYLTINEKGVYIVSTYDITKVFTERDRQLNSFLVLDASIILASTLAIFLFSIFLTRPINELNLASKKIAAGSYEKRANISSNDEIGELASSFNSMAEQIEDKIDKLNLAAKQKDDFISSFTHEIKTPMTSIIGYAYLLKTRKCNEEITNKSLDYIYSEAKRLELLSYKLMELMSLSQERIELKEFQIVPLLQEIASIKELNLENITLVVNAQEANVFGDTLLLDSMIRNLIENAKKARPKDNKIQIIGKIIENNKYRVCIIDTGCGIPKKELTRITEDFYMVDKSRAKKTGSSGIGLSICKKIANLHHTDLIIESEEGIGTQVYFELEVVQNEDKDKL